MPKENAQTNTMDSTMFRVCVKQHKVSYRKTQTHLESRVLGFRVLGFRVLGFRVLGC